MLHTLAIVSEFSVIISIDFVPKLYPKCVHTIRKIQIAKYTKKKMIGPKMNPYYYL